MKKIVSMVLFICMLSMATGGAKSLASDEPHVRVTKEMLVGTWVAYDDDPDLRNTYTFNSGNTGTYTFFDGVLDITEYSVTQDGENVILSYTMVAAEGEFHLTQEPVTRTYHLEYISSHEFNAVYESSNKVYRINYKRQQI